MSYLDKYETKTMQLFCPHCRKSFLINVHIDRSLGECMADYVLKEEDL